MKHIKALAIKFISCLALLYVILGLFYGMSFGNVFLISFVLGVAAYILGDLFLLPRTSNMIATATDFGLAFVIIWLMSRNMLFRDNIFPMVFIASLGVAVFEYFFHQYIESQMIQSEQKGRKETHLQYQTEVAEEITPDTATTDSDDNRK